jgi:hypothetical protein
MIYIIVLSVITYVPTIVELGYYTYPTTSFRTVHYQYQGYQGEKFKVRPTVLSLVRLHGCAE